jgi:hypothetical protein
MVTENAVGQRSQSECKKQRERIPPPTSSGALEHDAESRMRAEARSCRYVVISRHEE